MFSIITQTQINLHPQSPFYHSPCPQQCHRLKEIFPQYKTIFFLVQKHYSYSPKTFSFWYKNIIPTAQKHSPFGTKTLFLQPKSMFLTVQKDSPDSRKSSLLQAPVLQVMENTGKYAKLI